MHDLFPSILAALGLTTSRQLKLDGADQWPALAAGKTLPRPAFLIASHDIACIDGDWKLIEASDGKRSLFNLAKDIGESKDLSGEQPETLKALGAKLDDLKKDLPAAVARRGGGPGAGKGPPGKGKGFVK
jgi:arylsulfatase A-like enzyme